jgi:CspA family cold shock protein
MSFISSPFFYRKSIDATALPPGLVDETGEASPLQRTVRRGQASKETSIEAPVYGPDDEIDIESGTVKFFDPAKGFGFVVSAVTGEDVFLSAKILQAKGLSNIAPGTTILFEAEDAEDGKSAPSILEVLSVDESTATGPASTKTRPTAPPSSEILKSKGTVESWKEDKGFGFVRAENGDNIFVHVTVVGGVSLVPGAEVGVEYRMDRKGYVATSLTV